MLSSVLLEQLQVYLTSFQVDIPPQKQTISAPSFALGKAARKQSELQFEMEEVILADEAVKEISFPQQAPTEDISPLDDYIRRHQTDDTFHSFLFHLIDESGLPDADIYKRADIDRRHFSKIRSNPSYHPKKQTVLALCFALHLNEDNARYLLALAGYALSTSDVGDLIILFFLGRQIYNLIEINEALHYFGQSLLTAM